MGNGSRKKVGVFVLAMITVAAVISIRSLPITAEYGLASIFYIILAAVIFFIPVSLVSAELATGWPMRGGVYVWVKEAFGPQWGFLAIWLQWIENVIWYPTALSFIPATIAYAINPELANNKYFMLAFILAIFWGCTFYNFLGMRAAGFLSSFGVILGSILPGILIVVLGVYWLGSGHVSQIAFSIDNLVPDLTHVSNMVLLAGVLLGIAGMEMSAVHAKEVDNPRKDYPKAIFMSALIILVLTALGSLSIAVVVPQKEISLVAGVMEAFDYFFKAYHLDWMVPIVALLMSLGGLALVSTWLIGPSKGLLATAENGDIPPVFQKLNKHGMPVPILILQGVIVTGLSLIFLLMPSVNSSYWILTALTMQLYLIMYFLMFLAAIKLRYSQPNTPRAYKIPLGNFGMWVVAGIGILGALFTIIIGFVPPTQLKAGSTLFYEAFLGIGIFVFCVIPFIIYKFRKPEWVAKFEMED